MAENNSSAPLKTALPTDVEAFEHFVSDCDGAGIQYDGPSYEQGFLSGKVVGMDASQAVAAQAAPAAVAVPDEREAFEAFMRNDTSGFSLEREGKTYKEFEVATYWYFWHARAALAATPALPATEPAHAAVGLTDALRDLIEAIEYTPLGIRQIKALERARAAIKTEGEIPAIEDSSAGDLAEVQAEPVVAIKDVMELVKALVTSVNEAHHANSDGWRDVCFASAGQLVTQIEEKLGEALLAPVVVQAEPVAWDGKLPESLQRALNEMRLHCKPHIVSGLEFEVRQVFEGMHTSLSTVRRMYWAANARLEAIDEAQPDPLAAPQAQPADALDAARWRALLACGRIRLFGTAGVNGSGIHDPSRLDTYNQPYGNYVHFGAEFWSTFPDQDYYNTKENPAYARATLTEFADASRAAMAAAQEGGKA